MIILDAGLTINCKEERMEARRQGRKLLQLYRQKKYSSLDPSIGGRDEEKSSGSGYILEKESTDLDNRLYTRERDGKVRDDPQVWGLSSCVNGDSLS